MELSALGREERFLHTCFHASLGDNPPRLLALRDVAQVLLDGRLDLHLVRALAASWQADAVLARAVHLTWQTFRLDVAVSPLAAWATAYRPDHHERRALAAYTDPHGGYSARSAAALRAVPGVRDKAAYLRALAFPARDYLDPRHRGPRRSVAARGDRHPSPPRAFVIRTPPCSRPRTSIRSRGRTRPGPYRAIAHDFVVRTYDPALGEYLGAVLDPFSVDASDGDGEVEVPAYSVVDRGDATKNRYALYFGRERLALTPSGSFVVATLLWHVNRRAVESGDEFVLVHAGAVEWGGRAAIFPAPMESGKTTLVAGLVRAGARYLSDEAAAIDPHTLEVHPFPKSLTVGVGSWEVLADLTPVVDPEVTRRYLLTEWHVDVRTIRPTRSRRRRPGVRHRAPLRTRRHHGPLADDACRGGDGDGAELVQSAAPRSSRRRGAGHRRAPVDVSSARRG